MDIRQAVMSDAPEICRLVNYYAERGRMLHRSLESVYDSLREFLVAENADGELVGCVAVDTFWADLAEVKSLAVAPEHRRRGVGSRLLAAAVADARGLGIRKLFALTYEREFFERNGFSLIHRDTLPEKVWRECIACPRSEACDEVAMMRRLRVPRPTVKVRRKRRTGLRHGVAGLRPLARQACRGLTAGGAGK